VQHNSDLNSNCQCFLKTNPACCGTCRPIDFIFPNYQYNVYSKSLPVGDPTCATGVKSADLMNCCPATCSFCPSRPIMQVSFQPVAIVPPVGWAVDNGKTHGLRNNTYNQNLSSTYGWTCDLSSKTFDRDPNSHFAPNNPTTSNYHSTGVQTDFTACGSSIPSWDLDVGSNATTLVFEVHTLYSQQNSGLTGCTLNGRPNFDAAHSRLFNSDMAWVVRAVNVTTGKITFTGSNNAGCNSIAAMMVFSSTMGAPAVDCQTLNGTCCPHFLAMSERPCSSFPPPCALA